MLLFFKSFCFLWYVTSCFLLEIVWMLRTYNRLPFEILYTSKLIEIYRKTLYSASASVSSIKKTNSSNYRSAHRCDSPTSHLKEQWWHHKVGLFLVFLRGKGRFCGDKLVVRQLERVIAAMIINSFSLILITEKYSLCRVSSQKTL